MEDLKSSGSTVEKGRNNLMTNGTDPFCIASLFLFLFSVFIDFHRSAIFQILL